MTDASPAPLVVDASEISVHLLSGRPVVENFSLQVGTSEAIGLVGESGSGKTTIAMALLGYSRPGMQIVSGSLELSGTPVALDSEDAARAVRGRLVSHVPQDPATSLNPSLRIGAFIDDIVAERRSAKENGTTQDALARVHLPTNREFTRRFPHQLSGGQQQRVLIAASMVCEPSLIVLDEPTTGLDVVTQARVLEEIRRLHRERGLAMVYVSHDLSVISQIADRVIVMYAGRVVEHGPTAEVLTKPRHPYTRGLVSSIPDLSTPYALQGIPGVPVGLDDRPKGCAFAPRCQLKVDRCEAEMPQLETWGQGHSVRCFEMQRTPPLERAQRSVESRAAATEPLLVVKDLECVHKGRGSTLIAARDISFEIRKGDCLALVGESGSGKTTIARAIAGLHPPRKGEMTLDGQSLDGLAKRRPRELRRRLQIIFQNPFESLNPKQRVDSEVSRPARILRNLSQSEANVETEQLLERVRLPGRLARRFPVELSGGERQRVAIARALSANPEVLICDEITSALDVSVQAAILELLAELQRDLGLTLLFITHNLGAVAAVASDVVILHQGVMCEQGTVAEVFGSPQHPRTIELMESAPRLAVSGGAPFDAAMPSATTRA